MYFLCHKVGDNPVLELELDTTGNIRTRKRPSDCYYIIWSLVDDNEGEYGSYKHGQFTDIMTDLINVLNVAAVRSYH